MSGCAAHFWAPCPTLPRPPAPASVGIKAGSPILVPPGSTRKRLTALRELSKLEPSGASSCRGSSLGGDVLEPGSRGLFLSCRSHLTPSGTQQGMKSIVSQ